MNEFTVVNLYKFVDQDKFILNKIGYIDFF